MNRRNFIAISSALAGTSSLGASASAFERISSRFPGQKTAQATNIGAPAPSKTVFTLDEVKSLNAFQRAGVRHPFTCCWNSRDANHLDCEGVLVATQHGWICLYCDYTQDWAYAWMKNWKWKEMYRFSPAPSKKAQTDESDRSEMATVSIAIAAAKNCLAVFENQYPGDDRPRKALEAANQWLKEPTSENRRIAEVLENRVWRASRKNWRGEAGSAAEACGYAARALRHPYSSAGFAIRCERFANGRDWDYVSDWLWKLVRDLERGPWTDRKVRFAPEIKP